MKLINLTDVVDGGVVRVNPALITIACAGAANVPSAMAGVGPRQIPGTAMWFMDGQSLVVSEAPERVAELFGLVAFIDALKPSATHINPRQIRYVSDGELPGTRGCVGCTFIHFVNGKTAVRDSVEDVLRKLDGPAALLKLVL